MDSNIGITGASGLVGRYLMAKSANSVAIKRNGSSFNISDYYKVIIHLAAEPILGLWTRNKREAVWRSRVDLTKKLVEALLPSPPKLVLAASAVGFYGHRCNDILTESSQHGSGFLAELANAWEDALTPLKDCGTRIVNLRFGVIMSWGGGFLAAVRPIFRLGLGGRLGTGEQYTSWIAIDDVWRGIQAIIEDDSISGPVNLTAPEPLTNRALTAALAGHLHRPALFHIPTAVLRLLPGNMADEFLLASTRAIPQKLTQASFKFIYPSFQDFLDTH